MYGVAFYGVNELIDIASGAEGGAREGVYVGKDRRSYPCFDSWDYANEDRSYWNFVFARSKEELERKLERLRAMPWRDNYRKYAGDVQPVIYWQGDSHDPMEMLESEDIDIR